MPGELIDLLGVAIATAIAVGATLTLRDAWAEASAWWRERRRS